MNILVCVKQVPDTTEIKIDPVTKTLIRAGVPSIVNPFDAYALETAVRLKEKAGGTVTVLSMGPVQAEAALRDCLAVGADEAWLVTDRAFGGSDTLATSYILATAMDQIGSFDLILCGKQAIDGDTGQVGPEIAAHKNLAQVTYAFDVDVEDGKLYCKREEEGGYTLVEAQMPAVVTVIKTEYAPRRPSIKSKLAAAKKPVHRLALEDIPAMDAGRIGLGGSPTKVKKTFTPEVKGAGLVLRGETGRDAAAKLAGLLAEAELI